MSQKMILRVEKVAMSFRVGLPASWLTSFSTLRSAGLTMGALGSVTMTYHLTRLPYTVPRVENDRFIYHWDHDIIHGMIGPSYRGEGLEISIRLESIHYRLEDFIRYFRYFRA